MNQEQLNVVAGIYNESKRQLIESGEYQERKDKIQNTVSGILSAMSCYLYVYKDLSPDTYDIAKKVLQNITDLITIGVDIETCQPKEGDFSVEKQNLIYLGESK